MTKAVPPSLVFLDDEQATAVLRALPESPAPAARDWPNVPESCYSDQGFSSGFWVNNGAQAPFIFIDARETVQQVRGLPNGFVGHRMLTPGDQRSRGLFARWFWDGQTLTAEVDPLGFFSLFIYTQGPQIGISPSLLQLLANGADPTPDRLALAVFHRIGSFIDNDTPFAHIRTLAPGTRLTWTRGVLHIEGGTQPAPRILDWTREQAVEACIEIPRAAIARFLRQWDGPIALPLSGGRDSRHILLEMLRQGRKPDTCVTYHQGGPALNNEVLAARALTARAGLHHSVLGQPRQRLRDSVRALLLTQLCADEHAQMMPMHDFLSTQNMASIDGIGGDILTNPDDMAAGFMQRSRRGDFEGIARSLAAGHAQIISRSGHEDGAGAVYSSELEDAAIDRIATALRRHANSADPYQSFWFWNRTRREISFAPAAIMGNAATVFCPYLDPEMVELGLSLPWSVTQDQMLHDNAIHRAFPKYADIPFAAGFVSQRPAKLHLRRLHNIFDTLRIAAMLMPAKPAMAILDLMKSDKLKRAHADIYRLHTAIISCMDAQQAQRLMELGVRLDATSRKGENVVSDIFPAA